MAVSQIIEALRSLQDVDVAIRAIEEELDQLPKKLQAARDDHRAVEEKSQAAESMLEDVLKNRRNLEQQIAESEQYIVKFENDKLKVKTNEEFRALNSQIEQQKVKRSEIEDKVLLSYDEEEAASEKAKKLKQELELVARAVADREEDLKVTAGQDQQRLEELKRERESLVETLEGKTLSRYEAIRRRKGGIAVVPVVRDACGGCHTQQPPQKVNEIRKEDALHTCDFCGRFLVWGREGAAAT